MKISPNVILPDNVQIGDYTIIGCRSRPSVEQLRNASRLDDLDDTNETIIGQKCYIGSHVIIEEGVQIGENCIIDSNAVIEKNTIIGANTLIVHGARILQKSKIGSDCVIGGFVADRSIIGNKCRVLGELLHKQDKPHIPWDEHIENAPILDDFVFVGRGAMLIGGIHISSRVFVCAGAILTRNVASLSVVKGINDIKPISFWQGGLSSSSFWQGDSDEE